MAEFRFGMLVTGASLLCATPSYADVRLITQTGIQHFPQVQPAIDAAPPGALILLTAGNYSGFQIVGKAVSVVAFPNTAFVDDSITIRSTGANQRVLLSGLNVHAEPTDFQDDHFALTVQNAVGAVRIQDCRFEGKNSSQFPEYFALGAEVRSSAQVALTRCLFYGASGLSSQSAGEEGSDGIFVKDSNATLESCQTRGGNGGTGTSGGHGGSGMSALNSNLFLITSKFQGGNGGNSFGGWGFRAGDGGHGLEGGAGQSIDGTFIAGIPGYGSSGGYDGFPGLPISNSAVTIVPGIGRRLLVGALAPDSPASIQLTVYGEPGDRAYAVVGTSTIYIPSSNPLGTWLVIGMPLLRRNQPLGVIPASGSMQVQVSLPDLPAGTAFQRYGVQAVMLPASGTQAHLSGVSTLHLYDSSVFVP